jgi:hypothetical protein
MARRTYRPGSGMREIAAHQVRRVRQALAAGLCKEAELRLDSLVHSRANRERVVRSGTIARLHAAVRRCPVGGR